MKKLKIILALALAGFAAGGNATAQDADTNSPAWLTQPLSLMSALNTALQQNATILKAKNDLEASYGIVVQTRAIALPQVQATGQYTDNEITTLQNRPLPGFSYPQPDQNWNAGVQIVQSIYDGGKLTAAVRAATAHQAAGAGAIRDRHCRHAAGRARGVLRRAARRAANHRA